MKLSDKIQCTHIRKYSAKLPRLFLLWALVTIPTEYSIATDNSGVVEKKAKFFDLIISTVPLPHATVSALRTFNDINMLKTQIMLHIHALPPATYAWWKKTQPVNIEAITSFTEAWDVFQDIEELEHLTSKPQK